MEIRPEEPKVELHECSLCGFSDRQHDMIKDESTGEWQHAECVQDALDGERIRRTEPFDEQGDPDR